MKQSPVVRAVLAACTLSAAGCTAVDAVTDFFGGGGRTVIEAGCPRTIGAMAVIDYVPFVKLNDRSYLQVFVQPDEPQLEPTQLGEHVADTQCKLSDVVNDPNYRARNGDTAFLEPGTKLFAVKGFDPGFRLAAKLDGEIQLYEAQTVPGAERGADILGDIAEKVTAITVNSEEDGETVLGRISDPVRVDELVAMVLDAPIEEDASPAGSDLRYFLEFELQDTPPVNIVLFVSDGVLGRGIQVPDEFVAAIRRAASSA